MPLLRYLLMRKTTHTVGIIGTAAHPRRDYGTLQGRFGLIQSIENLSSIRVHLAILVCSGGFAGSGSRQGF
jgi:hypothetical protein